MSYGKLSYSHGISKFPMRKQIIPWQNLIPQENLHLCSLKPSHLPGELVFNFADAELDLRRARVCQNCFGRIKICQCYIFY